MLDKSRPAAASAAFALWFVAPAVGFGIPKPYISRCTKLTGFRRQLRDFLSLPGRQSLGVTVVAAAARRYDDKSKGKAEDDRGNTNVLASLLAEHGLVFELFHYFVFS
jgi:hypothetical protein